LLNDDPPLPTRRTESYDAARSNKKWARAHWVASPKLTWGTGPARYPECKEQRVFALRRCNLAARLLDDTAE